MFYNLNFSQKANERIRKFCKQYSGVEFRLMKNKEAFNIDIVEGNNQRKKEIRNDIANCIESERKKSIAEYLRA